MPINFQMMPPMNMVGFQQPQPQGIRAMNPMFQQQLNFANMSMPMMGQMPIIN